MTLFIIYYSIGLIVASVLSVGAYFILGNQGIYEMYKGDYPNGKLTVTEVNIYAHIATFLFIPLAYGGYVLLFGSLLVGKFWCKYVAPDVK